MGVQAIPSFAEIKVGGVTITISFSVPGLENSRVFLHFVRLSFTPVSSSCPSLRSIFEAENPPRADNALDTHENY